MHRSHVRYEKIHAAMRDVEIRGDNISIRQENVAGEKRVTMALVVGGRRKCGAFAICKNMGRTISSGT